MALACSRGYTTITMVNSRTFHHGRERPEDRGALRHTSRPRPCPSACARRDAGTGPWPRSEPPSPAAPEASSEGDAHTNRGPSRRRSVIRTTRKRGKASRRDAEGPYMLPGTGRRRAAENRVGNPSRLACRKGGHQGDNRQQALARARPGGPDPARLPREPAPRGLGKLEMEPPCDPATPLLGMHLEQTKSLPQRDACTPKFTAAIFTVARTRRRPVSFSG